MIQYSLTTSKDGNTRIKIHHDLGDFKFFLTPDEHDGKGFSWSSTPEIEDKKAGDLLARQAARSIAEFAKSDLSIMSFDEMVAHLRRAEKLAR